METKTSTWYETKVKYERTNDKGIEEKVSENYVIEATTCTEAETRIVEYLQSYSDLKVTKTSEANYKEILFENAEKFWKVKVQMITVDDSSEKEKRTSLLYLVQAKDIAEALKCAKELFSSSISDFSIVGITEANITEVIIDGNENY